MLTKEHIVKLSQTVGTIKRARNTVRSNAGVIMGTAAHYAGSAEEAYCIAVCKQLALAIYWLDQAIDSMGGHIERYKRGDK